MWSRRFKYSGRVSGTSVKITLPARHHHLQSKTIVPAGCIVHYSQLHWQRDFCVVLSSLSSNLKTSGGGGDMEWTDEYQKLVNRMNTPRVVIDNGVCSDATLVKVDSARKHGILLEAVQALTDLNLSINKAYISSDGRWFMDVFHVTDLHGRKLNDDSVLAFIEHSIGAGDDVAVPAPEAVAENRLTALELTGNDRPGLLSEIFAVLSDNRCSVVDAKVWTHNGRVASVLYLTDEETGAPIRDADRIHRVEARLRNVVKGDGDDARGATTALSSAAPAHADRRLHQMMFADRDYERADSTTGGAAPSVSVQNWIERGYSVVNVQCRERPQLLFDVVCTLTDMKYVVFHGTIDTDGDVARQEFYIRHSDGSPISSEAERQRVIQCLQAAIERRASDGMRLELCAADRRGLLADVTRTLRENGLSVTRAEVATKDGMAADVFHVTDAAGHPADPKAIEAVIEKIGSESIRVKEQCRPMRCRSGRGGDAAATGGGGGGVGLFYLGSLVKRNLYNLGLIGSCS